MYSVMCVYRVSEDIVYIVIVMLTVICDM
jgi:hypothetical protein